MLMLGIQEQAGGRNPAYIRSCRQAWCVCGNCMAAARPSENDAFHTPYIQVLFLPIHLRLRGSSTGAKYQHTWALLHIYIRRALLHGSIIWENQWNRRCAAVEERTYWYAAGQQAARARAPFPMPVPVRCSSSSWVQAAGMPMLGGPNYTSRGQRESF